MRWKVFSILLIILVLSGYWFSTNEVLTTYTRFHHASFNDKEFYGDVERAIPKIIPQGKIYGGILSHHVYVANDLAKYFNGFKNIKPKVIVLIGPNHYSLGNEDILISKYAYKTPWGIVEPDTETIEKLLKNDSLRNNERPFEIEHSIAANVSYIKYFFPDAKLVPIILKRTTSQDKLDSLVKELITNLPKDTLVLASVDFSHHGKEITSEFHDKKSVSAIQNFDYQNTFNLEIDSPSSIYVLLKYLESKDAYKMDYWNTNSAIFGGNMASEDVTSYLFAYFTKGEKENNQNISILNFGDMIFDRGVRNSVEKGKDPFEHIKGVEGNFLKGVDFIVANLEGPIIETQKENCQNKDYSFQFPYKVSKMLFMNNINIVNIANNHSFDCYEEGIESTKKSLDEYDIGYMGDRSLETSYTIKTVQNKKIAFVGIDTFTTSVPIEQFYNLVSSLKKENDYVVVNIHWGYEYDSIQSKVQEEIAHNLIDNGVDVIFGHHPHVIQPVEIYKNKVILYSLGNFIFDQLTKDTNTGIGTGVIFSENEATFYIFPFNIINTQPTLMKYEDMNEFCGQYLKDIQNASDCSFSI